MQSIRLAPLAFFAFLLLALPASAQNFWKNNTNPDVFSNPSEWTLNVVPDGSTDIQIGTGTVNGDTSFTNRNVLDIGSSATLNILSTTTITNAAGATIFNSGTLTLAGGTINGSGTLINPTAGRIQGYGSIGTNVTNSGAFLGGILAEGGTLTFSGQVTNLGVMASDTGNLVLSGQVTNGGLGGSIIGGSGSVVILDGANITGEGVAGNITAQNGATLNGVTLGATFAGNSGALLTDGSAVKISGTVTAVGGLGLGNGGVGATITGVGMLDNEAVAFGTGRIAPSILNNNSIIVGVTLAGIGPTVPLSGSGTLVLNGNVANTSGTILIPSGASLDLAGAQVNGGQIFGGLNGQILGQTFNGAVLSAEKGAMVQNVTFSPIGLPFIGFEPTAITLTGGSTLGLGGTVTISSNVTINDLGTLNNSGGLINSGELIVGSGGLLNNPGGISNLSGGLVVQSDGTLNNSGALQSDFFSGFGTQAGSTVLNTGTMSLAGNIIVIGGSLRNNGSITLNPGPPQGDPPITPPPPPLFVSSTGTLSGTGTVNPGFGAFDAQVIMQGVMAPGDPIGTFTINGNYSQSSGGTLDIFLGGTGAGKYGVLDVSNIAGLDGTVDFITLAGFTPVAGDDFTFLLFGSESGNFANMEFTNWMCPVGDTCKDVFAANSLTLEISAGGTNVPEPSSLLLLSAGLTVMLGLGANWSLRRREGA